MSFSFGTPATAPVQNTAAPAFSFGKASLQSFSVKRLKLNIQELHLRKQRPLLLLEPQQQLRQRLLQPLEVSEQPLQLQLRQRLEDLERLPRR